MLRVLKALCLSALAATSVAHADAPWPTRPVVIVAPSAPGGTTDLLARLAAEALTRELGQTFIVENRPGAGTAIANQIVARAKPDGHTLLLGAAALTINPQLQKKPADDPLRDFAPIRLVARMPNVVVVKGDGPLRNLAELVDQLKRNPGRYNYATPGVGTSVHLSTELFKSMTGTDFLHVAYKSSALSGAAVAAGEVLVAFENAQAVVPMIQAGKLRALAVTSAARSASLPEVPTVAEAGLAGYDVSTWFGLLAPAGTPAPIVARLDGAIRRLLQAPETQARLRALGVEAAEEAGDAFARLIASDYDKWGAVIRRANITVDD